MVDDEESANNDHCQVKRGTEEWKHLPHPEDCFQGDHLAGSGHYGVCYFVRGTGIEMKVTGREQGTFSLPPSSCRLITKDSNKPA
ncbi:unnamed protein product [Gongylonema pulchrum]|uniref:Protein kinase domain-containing protein n=1 Tax=Gongylonema pulchrum TaxID=637853 RepID=A0A183DSW6_9BILA|nr:unnamed protein product [Gongylonema pulchrum]